MSRRLIDLIDKQFGRWTVLSRNPDRRSHWFCKCACGRERSCYGAHLRSGKSLSCGCLRGEQVAQRNKANAKHGMFGTPTYNAWASMIERCGNPNCASYERYGGRGITVCDRWRQSFESFLEDLGERPENHSLGRIDNDGPYEPSNCRWETWLEQANNRRSSVFVEYAGRRLTVAQWARKLGINLATLSDRLFRLCWPVERALTVPVGEPRKKAA